MTSSWTTAHCEKYHTSRREVSLSFHVVLPNPVPHEGLRLARIPNILVTHTTHLCTFSMAATSASAARLKNADTAGISGVLLRVSAASGFWEPSSWQPVSVTFGRLLCSCSFGLSSVTKGKFIAGGSPHPLQRNDTEKTLRQTMWNELIFFVHFCHPWNTKAL